MHIIMRAVIFTIIVFAFTSSYANNKFSLLCPQMIDVTQKVSANYAGWRSLTLDPHYYLKRVSLYSGKPEERASLRPEFSTRKKAIWNFNPQDQVYVVCEYNQTSIELTQALPAHTTQCTVHYDPEVLDYKPDSILCTVKKPK